MVAVKGRGIEEFLRRPVHPVILVFGPDHGLVSERAATLLATVEADGGGPFGNITIDGDALAGNPERLADEAYTIPMFGGRRAIRVSLSARNLLPAVAPLLAHPPTDSLVVIEAGDLKPRAPLRRAFETADQAAAIACYGDDEMALTRLIDEEERASGTVFSAEARNTLQRLIGADRLASRGEIAKIALYCHPRPRVDAEDVISAIGDGSAVTLDQLSDAVGLGETLMAERALGKLISEGVNPGVIAAALARHFRQLAELRDRVDRGATAEAALKSVRPPVFFKREKSVRRQISRWSADSLAKAGELIFAAEAATRRRAELAEIIIDRCVLTLVRAGGQR